MPADPKLYQSKVLFDLGYRIQREESSGLERWRWSFTRLSSARAMGCGIAQSEATVLKEAMQDAEDRVIFRLRSLRVPSCLEDMEPVARLRAIYDSFGVSQKLTGDVVSRLVEASPHTSYNQRQALSDAGYVVSRLLRTPPESAWHWRFRNGTLVIADGTDMAWRCAWDDAAQVAMGTEQISDADWSAMSTDDQIDMIRNVFDCTEEAERAREAGIRARSPAVLALVDAARAVGEYFNGPQGRLDVIQDLASALADVDAEVDLNGITESPKPVTADTKAMVRIAEEMEREFFGRTGPQMLEDGRVINVSTVALKAMRSLLDEMGLLPLSAQSGLEAGEGKSRGSELTL